MVKIGKQLGSLAHRGSGILPNPYLCSSSTHLQLELCRRSWGLEEPLCLTPHPGPTELQGAVGCRMLEQSPDPAASCF